MRSTSILALAAAAFTSTVTAASISPRPSHNTASSLWIPPDLYAAEEPLFAGEPITLSPESDLSPSASSSSHSKISHRYAMTYTPYTTTGTCKSSSAITSDIALIASKGFTTIRLYATDCQSPSLVGAAARTHDLSLILGIYINEDGPASPMVAEQINTLLSWGQASENWDLVALLLIGNEAIFNEFVTAAELAAFMEKTRELFSDAGYEGPISTAEPVGILAQNKEVLCPVMDVVAGNMHPFFFSDVSAEDAGEFVGEQLDRLAVLCADDREEAEKEVLALEVGWPSAGSANGVAVPGTAEQKAAIEAMMRVAGSRIVLVSFEDDAWRDQGEFGVEQHWGCGELF